MRVIFKENKIIFIAYALISICILYFLLSYSKAEIHIYLNQIHYPIFDTFFKYITHIGDGLFVIIISIILGFYKIRYFIITIIPYLISSMLVQLSKWVFFPGMERPKKYLHDIYDLYLVQGIDIPHSRSFPSGHSATVFGFFIIIALISKNKYIKAVSLIIACLVAYSRVYLSFHFLIDIWVGSLVGIIAATIIYYQCNKIQNKWIDLPIQKIFKNEN